MKQTVAPNPYGVKAYKTTRALTCRLIPFTERQAKFLAQRGAACAALPDIKPLRPCDYRIERDYKGCAGLDLVICNACDGVIMPRELRPVHMWIARNGICRRARAVRRTLRALRDPIVVHTLGETVDGGAE